jgi:hypothetical protein
MENTETTKTPKIRGSKLYPLILHPKIALKELATLKGKARREYFNNIQLLTVIGYAEEGKVFVGVSVCSKKDAYCRKKGVKEAMERLTEEPLFVGTIGISTKSTGYPVKLHTYLMGYAEALSTRLLKKSKETSVSEIIGCGDGFARSNAEKSKIESEVSETSQTEVAAESN